MSRTALNQRILVLEYQRNCAEAEAAHWRECFEEANAEAAKWRNAHRSVVVSKRRLSAKYGRIMRRRPKALWRRAKKATRRSVTNVTHKLGLVR